MADLVAACPALLQPHAKILQHCPPCVYWCHTVPAYDKHRTSIAASGLEAQCACLVCTFCELCWPGIFLCWGTLGRDMLSHRAGPQCAARHCSCCKQTRQAAKCAHFRSLAADTTLSCLLASCFLLQLVVEVGPHFLQDVVVRGPRNSEDAQANGPVGVSWVF